MSPRHPLVAFVALLLACTCALAWADVPPRDIPGGHDSPLISRFPGSTMIGYRTTDFDQVLFPTGKWDDGAGRFSKTETVAGKVTDIAYAAPAGKSAYEVFHNYQAALAQAGFATQYTCTEDACGASFGLTRALLPEQVRLPMAHGDAGYGNTMLDVLVCTGGGVRLLTAKLTRPAGNVDVSLLVCGNSGYRVGVLQRIVEEKPMATGEITVNAKAMGEGLARNGHIALYGIHFATDSATLTADSGATLAQMATLLKSQPALKVFIVGHTDNTGTLTHNVTLSQHRAEAVVKALESRGIAAARLRPEGVASFAPVASNDTDAGRAKNRRVELVKQ